MVTGDTYIVNVAELNWVTKIYRFQFVSQNAQERQNCSATENQSLDQS